MEKLVETKFSVLNRSFIPLTIIFDNLSLVLEKYLKHFLASLTLHYPQNWTFVQPHNDYQSLQNHLPPPICSINFLQVP